MRMKIIVGFLNLRVLLAKVVVQSRYTSVSWDEVKSSDTESKEICSSHIDLLIRVVSPERN